MPPMRGRSGIKQDVHASTCPAPRAERQTHNSASTRLARARGGCRPPGHPCSAKGAVALLWGAGVSGG
eukprot:8457817-Alexandrium_andersonii.AAC.1